MNARGLPIALLMLSSLWVPGPAAGQSPASTPAASAPPTRVQQPPGDVRPAEPAQPQITVPLGRTPAAPATAATAATRRPAPGGSGIDDAVARCEALKGKPARAECMSQLRQSRKP